MSWPLMEKLLRHQQSVRSSEGCCVDRLSPPPNTCRAAVPGAAAKSRREQVQQNLLLFDHLVSEQYNRLGYYQPKRFGGL
jgi:hypothetical protein